MLRSSLDAIASSAGGMILCRNVSGKADSQEDKEYKEVTYLDTKPSKSWQSQSFRKPQYTFLPVFHQSPTLLNTTSFQGFAPSQLSLFGCKAQYNIASYPLHRYRRLQIPRGHRNTRSAVESCCCWPSPPSPPLSELLDDHGLTTLARGFLV